MEVKQVAELCNDITREQLGEEALLTEDLSNVVDWGKSVENIIGYDNFSKKLVNRIGKTVFRSRPYYTSLPSLIRDKFEFGAILQKIEVGMYDASENQSWQLEDGEVYEENMFIQPSVDERFWVIKDTFEIRFSVADRQVKESLKDASALTSFINALWVAVENSFTIKFDGLIKRDLNTLIASVLNGNNSNQKVDLLALYNAAHTGATITREKALETPEFIRFMIYKLKLDRANLKEMNVLHNEGGRPRFTSDEYLQFVTLADVDAAAGVYLYNGNGQFNNDELKLDKHETVASWQGQGTDAAVGNRSKISVKLPDGNTVTQDYVLAVMFDKEAAAVYNEDRRTTSKYVAAAEFTNYWMKGDVSLFVDKNEQAIVYYLGANPV